MLLARGTAWGKSIVVPFFSNFGDTTSYVQHDSFRCNLGNDYFYFYLESSGDCSFEFEADSDGNIFNEQSIEITKESTWRKSLTIDLWLESGSYRIVYDVFRGTEHQKVESQMLPLEQQIANIQ